MEQATLFYEQTYASTLTPLLKWAGGKRWLVPVLSQLWHGHADRRLVEPFSGGLAVTFGLLPRTALLNDINPHLMNFYTQVRAGALSSDVAFENDSGVYYQNRNDFNALIQKGRFKTKKSAALFYYLNRTGFNGLCRFNRSGLFNVPFGRYTNITYCRSFPEHTESLAAWEFASGDFESLRIKHSDFLYVDPPYDVPFTQYSSNGFAWKDQVRLVDWLRRHKGPIVISNQATPRVCRLYRDAGYQLTYLRAPRLISCNGDRTPAKEVLATRNLEVPWLLETQRRVRSSKTWSSRRSKRVATPSRHK